MSEAPDAAVGGGEDNFAAEMEAARVADEGLNTAGEGEDGQPGEVEAEAGDQGEKDGKDPKPPLPPEEIERRYRNQQQATRQERQRRQELERTLSTMQERIAQLEGPRADGADDLGERPDPTEDPVGYLEYMEKVITLSEAKQAQQREQEQLQQQRAAEVQQVVSRVKEFEDDFRELHSDYDAAADHLYEVKKAEYVESGYGADEAHQMVMAEFLTRSRRAFAAGKDPAEIVYNLAKKAGYAVKTGDAKLEAIERGQRATSPLSSGGGGQAGEMTIESVSKLNGAAFDAAFEKLAQRAQDLERARL